jgi:Ras-related protein Rab-4B
MNTFSNSVGNGSADNQDYVFKFVIIGDSGVGKSCIMHHFIYNKCNIFLNIVKKETTQTLGVEFSSKNIKIGNKEIRLQIWDTAGQEKFRSVARSYYRGAIGVIIVYDITK